MRVSDVALTAKIVSILTSYGAGSAPHWPSSVALNASIAMS
jgi:hypothetical protein